MAELLAFSMCTSVIAMAGAGIAARIAPERRATELLLMVSVACGVLAMLLLAIGAHHG